MRSEKDIFEELKAKIVCDTWIVARADTLEEVNNIVNYIESHIEPNGRWASRLRRELRLLQEGKK